jgi:hypothetical protein
MRLKDSPEEAAWRETVRNFIKTELALPPQQWPHR